MPKKVAILRFFCTFLLKVSFSISVRWEKRRKITPQRASKVCKVSLFFYELAYFVSAIKLPSMFFFLNLIHFQTRKSHPISKALLHGKNKIYGLISASSVKNDLNLIRKQTGFVKTNELSINSIRFELSTSTLSAKKSTQSHILG